MLDREHRTDEAHVDRALPVVDVGVDDQPARTDTGVGERDVEASERLGRGRGERFDRGFVGDVALDDAHRVAERLLHRREPRLVDVADDHARAVVHEPLDRGEADARAATGHECDPILEPHAGAFSTTSSGAIS